MILLRFIFLATFIVTLSAAYVPYQAHSFNDLDYLSNIIHKGIDYFKVDISMATRQSCEQHSTWDKNSKCFETSQYIQEICCLAMRGDASSRPYFNYDFNTTDQFIALLDEQLEKIVANEPNRKLLFAINFQYDHKFQDFLSQKFLLNLAQIQQKYHNNVLIGTGSDSFILEYDRVCFGAGTSLCTSERKTISNSNFFLQSSSFSPYDSRDHKKRYRNFNVMFKQIQRFCREGFPSWITKYPEFPLIFWEPSNEKQVQYTLDWFLKPSCVQKHKRTINGMAMASNIDVEMFETYMKKLKKGSSWNFDSEKLYLEGSNMRMVKSKNSNNIFMVYKVDGKTMISLFEKTSDGKFQRITNRTVTIIEKYEKITHVLDSGYNYIIVTEVDENVSNVLYYSYDLNILTHQEVDRAYASSTKNQQFLFLKYNKDTKNHIFKGTRDFSEFKEYFQFQSDCIFTSMIITSSEYVFVGSNQNKQVWMVSVSSSTYEVLNRKMISKGEKPMIKEKNGKIIIIIESSMCHSGLLMNNNDMNKCTFFKEEQFESLATVHGIITLLQAENLQNIYDSQDMITACSKKIKFTKLMNSYDVDVDYLDEGYLTTGGYLPVENQDLVGSLFCGGSNYDHSFSFEDDGLILTTMNSHSQKQHQKKNLIKMMID